MPSKIRPIMQYAGQFYAGGNVKRNLIYWYAKYGFVPPVKKPGVPEWKFVVDWYKAWTKAHPSPPQGMWVFREEPLVKNTRSRYKLLCNWGGFQKPIPSKRDKKRNKFLFSYAELLAADTIAGTRPRITRNAPRPRTASGTIPEG